MLTKYTENVCLAAPGLAIATTTTYVKWGNTFSFKAAGRISGSITTNNTTATSLLSAPLIAPYPSGTTAKAGNLATAYYRIYTLVGTLAVNGTGTVTPTYTWLASADFSNTADLPDLRNAPMPDASNQCAIGFVIVQNASGSDFVPGTTALNASNVTTTYIDNYANNK